MKYAISNGKTFAEQERRALQLMQEKSVEMFRRLDALGVKYTVFQDCVEIDDVPPEKLEAVQNVFSELWLSGEIGERLP